MDKIGDITTLTRKTPCPDCGDKRLEFLLRCDLNYGACLYTAHCPGCDTSFEIVTGDAEPDLAALGAAVVPCPVCGKTERIATLHCELSSKSCVYTLECATCAVH
jgi:transcription elongation factor Elf1